MAMARETGLGMRIQNQAAGQDICRKKGIIHIQYNNLHIQISVSGMAGWNISLRLQLNDNTGRAASIYGGNGKYVINSVEPQNFKLTFN